MMRTLPAVVILMTAVAVSSLPVVHAELTSSPEQPGSKADQCVAPLDVMRRQHMTLMAEQKDRAIYQGLRQQRFSLTGCVDCHATKGDGGSFQRVDAPGQFCAACHEFAGVQIDCFSCHAATPHPENRTSVGNSLSAQAFHIQFGKNDD